jgi:hypothetical protein
MKQAGLTATIGLDAGGGLAWPAPFAAGPP